MHEVKRYSLNEFAEPHTYPVGPGSYVATEDYDALHAEAEALRTENARLRQTMLRLVATHCAAAMKNNATDAELEQYLSAGIAQLEAERDTLRQQLSDVFEGNTKLHVLWTEAVRQRDKLAEALRRGVDHVTNARHDVEVRANAGNEAAKLVLAGIDSWLINDARATLSELTP